MNSLKELVEQHGLGITVKSANPSVYPFRVLRSLGTKFYEVQLIDKGSKAQVLKECKLTNDYSLIGDEE